MVRRIFYCVLAGALLVAVVRLDAQMTDEQKKALFLKAREDIRPVPRPKISPTPRPKPRPAATPRATPKATPKPPPSPTPARETKPTSPPPVTDDDDIIPLEREVERARPTATPQPRSSTEPAPRPRQTPEPKPTPGTTRQTSPRAKDVPIVIEKSGLSDERGYEPPAPKARSGGWFKRYRYLTPAVRRAIDQAPVRKGQWQYIIIHNSGTKQGNARIFGNYHLKVRKMRNGLAYHFVIGNW